MVRAALDLGMATRWRTSSPQLRIRESPQLTWRIGDYRYIYVPVIDDRAFDECVEQQFPAGGTVLLVPAGQGYVFKHALQHVLGAKTPLVMSFDSFMSLRLSFSSADAKWTGERALLELITAYNRRSAAVGGNDSLLVEVPGTAT
jgi:hypothetical protein